MIPVKHIDPDDLALYAMQLLPRDEMEEMAIHLQHSAEARKVLSEIYGDLSIFAHTADMHSPPALTRQRLMKHVAREKKAIPIDATPRDAYTPRATIIFDEEPPKKSVAARILPWTGWALAAGLALGFTWQYEQHQQLKTVMAVQQQQLLQTVNSTFDATTLMNTVKDPASQHAALTASGTPPPPEGRASYVADKGALVFLATNLEPLQAYKTYELWLIPSDGRDPIPAGTFHPDEHGNASVVLPQLPKGVQAKAFGVTIEDGEGTQTPTLPIILKGAAS